MKHNQICNLIYINQVTSGTNTNIKNAFCRKYSNGEDENTRFLANRLPENEGRPDTNVLAIPEINSLPARVRYSNT